MSNDISHNKPRISVAQLGARMHYAVPRLFHQQQMLSEFFTDFWYPHFESDWQPFHSLIPDRFRSLIETRSHPDLADANVHHFPKLGLSYARALRKASDREEETKAFLEAGNKFCNQVTAATTRLPDLIYGFNTASLEWFSHFKKRGVTTVLEQTLVPRASEERFLKDEFAQRGLSYKTGRWHQAYIEREKAEWDVADHILCASRFVAKELERWGVSADKITIIPYGYSPDNNSQSKPNNLSARDKCLNLLFVGNGGYRKGVPYLIEMLQTLNDNVTMTFAGDLEEELASEINSLSNATALGSVQRTGMSDLYRSHDVFILPSLCEGSATVIYEAMSFGLAVICTPNSGSVVEHDKEGQIIPIKDSSAIVEAINRYVEDRHLLKEHKQNALATSKDYTVERYGERLVSFVNQIV